MLGLSVNNYPAYKEIKNLTDSVVNLDSLAISYLFLFLIKIIGTERQK